MIEKLFFSWRKMILKILLENLDFSIEKIDFSIEKIEIFVFSPKINILFSIFFEIKMFKIIFLQEKKSIRIFFLAQSMSILQGFMLRIVWESLCRREIMKSDFLQIKNKHSLTFKKLCYINKIL